MSVPEPLVSLAISHSWDRTIKAENGMKVANKPAFFCFFTVKHHHELLTALNIIKRVLKEKTGKAHREQHRRRYCKPKNVSHF